MVFRENRVAGVESERGTRGVHNPVGRQLGDERPELPDFGDSVEQHDNDAAVAGAPLRGHQRAVRAGAACRGPDALLPPPAGDRARPARRLPRHHRQDGARRERDPAQQGPHGRRRRDAADSAAEEVQVGSRHFTGMGMTGPARMPRESN